MKTLFVSTKTLFFILAISISVLTNGQNTIRNMTIYNISGFVNDCLKELKVDSTLINIQSVDGLILGKFEAVCKKDDIHYTIAISNILYYDDVLKAIAHELVHIQQYTSKKLKILDGDNIEFSFVRYKVTYDSHYNDPQEIEARNVGLQLYKKFKNYLFD